MLHRLWLTDDQADLVAKALRFYSRDLQRGFNEAMMLKDSEAAEDFNDVINKIDDLIDIITED